MRGRSIAPSNWRSYRASPRSRGTRPATLHWRSGRGSCSPRRSRAVGAWPDTRTQTRSSSRLPGPRLPSFSRRAGPKPDGMNETRRVDRGGSRTVRLTSRLHPGHWRPSQMADTRTRPSARPGQLCRPQLAEDRSHVLERPLFADLSVVPDAVDVYGVPLNGAAGRGNPEQVAGVGRADDETQRDQILACDHVLDLGLDPGERADEPAEHGDDRVDPGDRPERAAVPHDILREELARALRVATVEDAGNVIPGDGHPVLRRESLDHGFPPECLSWRGHRRAGGWGLASRKSLVRDPE